MKKGIKTILPIAEAVQRLLHPYAEVVIHDIKTNKIAAIYNPFSKRRVGDPSLLGEEAELAKLENCTSPYEKINWDGKKLKSISSIIRDDHDEAVGLFCINLDISVFEQFQSILNHFLNTSKVIPQPGPLFKDDWQERIHQYIHTYLNERHLTLNALNKKEKKELIQHLRKMGAFSGKNAAHYIAQIVNISKATVYNYLSE